MTTLKEVGESIGGLVMLGAISFAAWSYCQPGSGYIRDPNSYLPWRHVWKPGSEHPKFPNIAAAEAKDRWSAKPGYKFTTDVPGDFRVSWTPGQGHPAYGNIRADSAEGYWATMPGYRFAGGVERLSYAAAATWTPGVAHPEEQRAFAAEKEKHWYAQAGYDFVRAGEIKVAWKPGLLHFSIGHVRADGVEGRWVADPGYRFADTGTNRSRVAAGVAWAADNAHPNCPMVVTSDEQDVWKPVSGYRLATAGRLDVVAIPTESASSSSPSGWEIAGRVLLAFGANALATPQRDDGFFATAGRFVAKEVRDHTVRSLISSFAEGKPREPEVIACDHWGGLLAEK